MDFDYTWAVSVKSVFLFLLGQSAHELNAGICGELGASLNICEVWAHGGAGVPLGNRNEGRLEGLAEESQAVNKRKTFPLPR